MRWSIGSVKQLNLVIKLGGDMTASNLYGAKSSYKIAEGHDALTSSLQFFSPQPRSLGLRYTRVTYLGGGNPYAEGPYIELQWSALDDMQTYNSILAQVGLDDSLWRSVTLLARNDTWNYHIYNGLAVRPFLGTDASWEYFPRDITILIKNLVQIG